MNLSEAAQLTGLTVSGIRARAKKDPKKYGLERDNAGRIFLSFDVDEVQRVKPASEGNDAATVQALQALLHEVREDRDHWRQLAQSLAARRRSWFF